MLTYADAWLRFLCAYVGPYLQTNIIFIHGRVWFEFVQLSEQQLLQALLSLRLRQLPRAKAALVRARELLAEPLSLARMDLAADLAQVCGLELLVCVRP
jgi:hypothetical protein